MFFFFLILFNKFLYFLSLITFLIYFLSRCIYISLWAWIFIFHFECGWNWKCDKLFSFLYAKWSLYYFHLCFLLVFNFENSDNLLGLCDVTCLPKLNNWRRWEIYSLFSLFLIHIGNWSNIIFFEGCQHCVQFQVSTHLFVIFGGISWRSCSCCLRNFGCKVANNIN